MAKEIKVYVVGGNNAYASWIDNYTLVENLEDAEVVIFTGGEDVDPSIYGKNKLPNTYSNIERDKYEQEIFKKIKPNQLAWGICRGSQLLCALNGGNLVQHCTDHAIAHTHSISDGIKMVEITSTHHQMQCPFDLNPDHYDILYWASPKRSSAYYGFDLPKMECEPEIVHYHVPGNPDCVAVQGHPEYMRKDAPIINILNELLLQCLLRIQ